MRCHRGTPLPEAPLASFHDPETKEKVRDSVGHDARHHALRAIGNPVIERARNERREPVRGRMGEAEPNRYHRKGKPREGAKCDAVEFFVDQIAKQESTPEDLLDQWNHNDQPQKAEDDRTPVGGWPAGKNFGIKAVETRRETEKSLRGNPQGENHERNHERKSDLPGCAQLIFAPKPEEQQTTQYRLSRVEPILRGSEPKGAAHFSEQADQSEQNEKHRHGQRESQQLSQLLVRRIHLVFRLNG